MAFKNSVVFLTVLIAALLIGARQGVSEVVELSPDVTIEIGGIAFDDHDVIADDLMGSTTAVPLGALPDATDVNAYDIAPNGDLLFSLDITRVISGVGRVGPADVVRFDGATHTLLFDASAEGVPDGVIVDAVGVRSSGHLLLSFDITVDLGGLIAADEDLVRFNGSVFKQFFDGTAESVAEHMDLDAAHFRASDEHLFLSFDGSGVVDGVTFDDEDVLEFDAAGPSWSLFYDASAEHADWPDGADLDAVVIAVPEPASWLMLVAGAALVSVLHRRRAS